MKIGESFILIGQQEALRREGEAGVFQTTKATSSIRRPDILL
jgi:hypothetical protein